MEMSSRDFSMYYSGTLFNYPILDSGIMRPTYISEVGDGNYTRGFMCNVLYVTSRFKVKRKKVLILPELIDTHMPGIGSVNTPEGVVRVSKTCKRTANKGASTSTYSLRGPYTSFKLSTDSGESKCKFIWNLFNPEYPSVLEALRMLADGEVRTVAVAKDTHIKSKPGSKTCIVYNRDVDVGEVVDNQLVLQPQYSFLDSPLMELGFVLK